MINERKFKVGDIIVFNSDYEDRVNIPRGVISMQILYLTEKKYVYIFLTHYYGDARGENEQFFSYLESVAHKKISPNSIWKELNT